MWIGCVHCEVTEAGTELEIQSPFITRSGSDANPREAELSALTSPCNQSWRIARLPLIGKCDVAILRALQVHSESAVATRAPQRGSVQRMRY